MLSGALVQHKRDLIVTLIIFIGQATIFSLAWFRASRPETFDFPAFYSAARLWESGNNPYDLKAQCNVQIPIRGSDCLPMAHAPILLPFVSLVSNDNFILSYWRWSAVLVFVWALCVLPIHLFTDSLKYSLQALLFIPALVGIMLSQETPFLLMAVLLWAFLLLRNQDVWAGLALSLIVIKPHLALLLGVPLLFSRLRAFLGFACGSLLLAVYSLFLVGVDGLRGMVQIGAIMAQGKGFGVSQDKMFNVAGLLVRTGLNPRWSWLFFILGLVFISYLWRKGITASFLSIGMMIALLISPHLHFHDLSLLLVPALLLSSRAPAIISIAWLMGYLLGFEYFMIYAVMATLIGLHLNRLRVDTSQAKLLNVYSLI
jgi:glycosyl transferase family 87